MRNGLVAVFACACMAVVAPAASAAEETQVERAQAALDAWLAAQAPLEKVLAPLPGGTSSFKADGHQVALMRDRVQPR